MFERYTEDARRVIFFARYETQHYGSPYIEPEHLLLGLLRDSRSHANRLFGLKKQADRFRQQIKQQYPSPSTHSIKDDVALSTPAKYVLYYATQEADQLGSEPLDTEHLVLGLLREEKSLAAKLLAETGVELESARKRIGSGATPEPKAMSPIAGIALILLLLFAIGWIFSMVLDK